MPTYKQIRIGVMTGLLILFFGLALNGYDSTLAKKLDLRENYIKKDDIEKHFATKPDIQMINFKLSLMLDHFKIAYDVHTCPNPPCPAAKKQKTEGLATGQETWGYE